MQMRSFSAQQEHETAHNHLTVVHVAKFKFFSYNVLDSPARVKVPLPSALMDTRPKRDARR